MVLVGYGSDQKWGWGLVRRGGWHWWAMGQIGNGVGISLDWGMGGIGELWVRSGMGLGFR